MALDFLRQAFGIDIATGQGRPIGPTEVSYCSAEALHEGRCTQRH